MVQWTSLLPYLLYIFHSYQFVVSLVSCFPPSWITKAHPRYIILPVYNLGCYLLKIKTRGQVHNVIITPDKKILFKISSQYSSYPNCLILGSLRLIHFSLRSLVICGCLFFSISYFLWCLSGRSYLLSCGAWFCWFSLCNII